MHAEEKLQLKLNSIECFAFSLSLHGIRLTVNMLSNRGDIDLRNYFKMKSKLIEMKFISANLNTAEAVAHRSIL